MKIYLLVIFSFILLQVRAQVNDHFDDGDFSVNPSWYGDSSDFNVNAGGQLQLNATIGGNSFLSLQSNLASFDSVEWRFFIRLNFSPSSSNYARVYLSSDQADLEQPLNGYFLRFGEALSNDAIELFRQNGTTITSICRGQDGLISGPFSSGVRIVRNSNGLWTLSVDYNGGEDYAFETAGYDSTLDNGLYTGINYEYTSSNTDRFYFDNYYAGPIILDTTPPDVSEITAEAATVLSITFSERMDSVSLADFNNYTVDNNIGHPVAVLRDSTNSLKYILWFSSSFQPGQNYTITFDRLNDQAQNQAMNLSYNFIYTPVVSATYKDVIFSEIYFEPSSSSPLPNSEYIELYNRRDSSIVLSGWKISDGSSDGLIPEIHLGPHAFVMLYATGNDPEFNSIPNASAVPSFPTLNNDVGDHLILQDQDGNTIDELKFDDSYYHDNNKNDGGWSIERIDHEFTCNNAENWKSSTANTHGTPGLINSVNGNFSDHSPPFVKNAFIVDSLTVSVVFSEPISQGLGDTINYIVTADNMSPFNPISVNIVSTDTVLLNFQSPFSKAIYSLQVSSLVEDCPGNPINTFRKIRFGFPEKANEKDIVINELLFYSYDGGNDFIEIYNRSQKIIDLKDWILSETDFNDTTMIKETAIITKDHFLIFPGDYLVFSEEENKVKAFYNCPDQYAFLNVYNMPDFNSDEGSAVINDAEGNTIDRLQYNIDMHFPLIVNTKGVSLERLSTEVINDERNNWHSAAATAGFATPGWQNSQEIGLTSGGNEVSVGMEIFSPDNDGFDDVLTIHYKFPQAGTVLSLNVFDSNGQPVRTLLAGQTVSSEGVISWDGLTDDYSIASSGIYILLARSFDLEGNSNSYKRSCFLTRLF